VQYGINEEFRQEVIQVADELDLDELHAASLYLDSQTTAEELDRPVAMASIFRFHALRETLLESLRLTIQQAVDCENIDDRERFITCANLITERPDATFWRKCVDSMVAIEEWLQKLRDRLNQIAMIGQTAHGYALETLQFEQQSLTKQHESMGAIISHLIKVGTATVDDYRHLLNKTAQLGSPDDITLHYLPALVSCASVLGPVDSAASLRDARGLDQYFADKSDNSKWRLPDFRAAATVFWLAEYSGRYIDNPIGSPLRGVDLDAETDARSQRYLDAVRNGAFEFILFICAQVRADLWHDPAKAGLVSYLLAGSERFRNGPIKASEYFQEILSQNLQLFVDAFITNMPDTIRRLKFEEDEQRRNLSVRQNHSTSEHGLHLERFLVIISYAFKGFPEAAQSFWQDPDSNLYGFLQWASKRQSTPRAAAFCEMFLSISEDAECAEAAHRFLLDDATTAVAKLRRGAPLSWTQILSELSFYAPGISDKLTSAPLQGDGALAGPLIEPESELMLECYLRLITHMCRSSISARTFVLTHPMYNMHEVVLNLAVSGVSNRLKACTFMAISASLTDKSIEAGYAIWDYVDSWMYDSQSLRNYLGTKSPQNPAIAKDGRFKSLLEGFELPNAFTRLVQSLIVPSPEESSLRDMLPFPEQLGAAYRMTGMDPYVDFILGSIFQERMSDLPDLNQIWELRCTCLEFVSTCLSTFNEDLVIFANSTNIPVDSIISTSSLAAYVRFHPFARVMEWLFNDKVSEALFAAAHEDVDKVSTAAPGSPVIMALCRSIEVINQVLKLQSIYFDVVRPIVKTQYVGREKAIANPALASFEDVILNHVNIIVDLGLYCGTGHQELTMLSLQLLQKLATARKLSIATGSSYGGSRVLAILQQDSDVDRIAASFVSPLQLDSRELEMGAEGPGIAIKQGILDLLNSSLETAANRPSLAHCLLGFRCTDKAVSVPPNGLFAKGASLFHAVAKLSADTISLPDVNQAAWLSSIRRTSCQIISKLLHSSLTERVILEELRESGYSDAVAIVQSPINAESLWSNRVCADPEFLISDSASIFKDFLIQRVTFFEEASLTIRSTIQRNAPTQRQKVLSSLLGVTILSTGEQVQNASLFELFDFIDVDMALPFQMSEHVYVTGLDFNTCKMDKPDSGNIYDLALARELLLLREADLRKGGKLADPASQQQCAAEIDAAMLCLQSENNFAAIIVAQRSALNVWVKLMSMMLALGDFEAAPKTALALQALQIVLPKLDRTIVEASPATIPLAKLIYTLMRVLDSSAANNSRDVSAVHDRLTAAFRTALRGVGSASGGTELRETCYQTIRHFIRSVCRTPSPLQSQMVKIIEHGGERLMDTICEDVMSSTGSCRVSALMVLESCLQLFQTVKSQYLTKAMTKLNFTSVLVDGIRGIAGEFQQQREGQGMSNRHFMMITGS
jgi:nuclear pore complex protein Nup205